MARSSEFEAPKNPSDFLYLGNTDPLSFNFFRPKQPNAKTGDQCLVSYLSLEPNASVYDFPCEAKNWQWASCTACFLPNTFDDYSNIVTRGLCSRTKFDTLFEVKRISRLIVSLITSTGYERWGRLCDVSWKAKHDYHIQSRDENMDNEVGQQPFCLWH